jgi:hypothetical protein
MKNTTNLGLSPNDTNPMTCQLHPTHPKTRAMAKPWKKTVGSACSLGKAIETLLPNEFMFIQLK